MGRVCLFLFIALTCRGQECVKPLGATDLQELLTKKVSEAMVKQLITSCGLMMTLDDTTERELRRLGATEALMALVKEKATSATRTELELRAEVEHWSSIKDSTSPAVFNDYLKRYPNGRFVVPAQAKLAALTSTGSPATAPAAMPSR